MEDIIDIIVTETTNTIEITSQPTDEIIDVNIIDNREDITLNVTPTLVEVNINSLVGNFGVNWGEITGTLSNQTDLNTALGLKADLVGGKVPSSQLPSYVDDVVEVANYASLPATGETGKIYITIDTNYIYRWTGSVYVEIKDSSAVWGAITGTLSNQTDLQNALNAKQNQLNGTGFVKASGTSISYDNSTYLTTSDAASTYLPLSGGSISGLLTVSTLNGLVYADATGQLGTTQGTTDTIAYWSSARTVASLATTTYPSLTELSYVKGVTSAIQTQLNSKQATLSGTGFVKSTGGTISYDNTSYLPLTGGTLTGNLLGTNITISNTLIAKGGTFNGGASYGGIVTIDGLGSDLLMNRADTSNGTLITMLTNAGEMWSLGMRSVGNDNFYLYNIGLTANALTIAKSNSAATFASSVTATSLIKSGGTSSQFLKADGSVDSSTYLTTGTASSTYLPLSGGTLTGALSGTSATFTTTSTVPLIVETTSGNSGVIIKTSSSTYNWLLGAQYNVGNGFEITASTAVGGTTFSTPLFVIKNNGNTLINTTTDAGYKLDVNGTGRFTGYLYITNTGTHSIIQMTRASTTYGAGLSLYTGGTQNWLVGTAWGETSSNFILYNAGTGTQSFKVDYSTNAATFSSSVTAIGTMFLQRASNGATTTLQFNNEVGANRAKIIFGGTNEELAFFAGNGASENMRITSSGNVGIGTSSPSSYSGYGTLTINGTTGSEIDFMSNGVVKGYLYVDGSNNMFLNNISNGYLNFATGNTDRMRITSSGNVGIGTTNPTAQLQVSSASGGLISINSTVTNTFRGITFQNNAASDSTEYAYIKYNATSGEMRYYANPAAFGGFTSFYSNNTESMRITSGGNVLIGTTSDSTGAKLYVNGVVKVNEGIISLGGSSSLGTASRGGNGYIYYWIGYNSELKLYYDATGFIGQFSNSTGVYTPLSDRNKKKDFELSNIGLNEIMQLKPTLYRMKTDTTNGQKELGFIAQDVKEVIPNAYVENQDFIGLNFNPIVAALTKAVQELKTELDTLKTK